MIVALLEIALKSKFVPPPATAARYMAFAATLASVGIVGYAAN